LRGKPRAMGEGEVADKAEGGRLAIIRRKGEKKSLNHQKRKGRGEKISKEVQTGSS